MSNSSFQGFKNKYRFLSWESSSLALFLNCLQVVILLFKAAPGVKGLKLVLSQSLSVEFFELWVSSLCVFITQIGRTLAVQLFNCCFSFLTAALAQNYFWLKAGLSPVCFVHL